MKTRVAPEDLAGAAVLLDRGASAMEDAFARGRPATTTAVTAAAGVRAAALGPLDGGFETAYRRGQAVAAIERDVAVLAGMVAAESLALHGVGTSLRQAARVYAAVEDGVRAGLSGLDRFLYDHPEVAEWGARGILPVAGPLVGLADGWGFLNERTDRVVALKPLAAREGRAPTGLADLVAEDVEVSKTPGLVRVTELIRPDGSRAWLVSISGTQDWGLAPGSDPFDATADANVIRQHSTAAAIGVNLALLDAQGRAGVDTSADPVLTSGHSLGGMVALTLASEPGFRHGRTITGALTSGSPTGGFDIPDSTRVVSLEKLRDPVPRLDGTPARQEPNWRTIVADPAPGPGGRSAVAEHDGAGYAALARGLESGAVPSSTDVDWHATIEPFVGQPGTRAVVHDYVLTREWQNPRS